MKCKVIIPSAKAVPDELQKIGKLPAVIYPINQRIVFDYLYEQYKGLYIKIICYDKAALVHQRLAQYRNGGLVIENLPFLEDLGNTIYYALRDIEGPIIINFADTIVFDGFVQGEEDAYFYSKDYFSDKWTYFDEEGGRITLIRDKVSVPSGEKGKLFVGVFQIRDSQYFRKCLELASSIQGIEESTFYYALKEYSKRYAMRAVEAVNWLDVGHADTYVHSGIEVKAREFNHISIDENRGILRKESKDKDKLIAEIKWYLKLPLDLEYVRPRIFNYSITYENPYVSMEYYSYHTVHELFLYGELTYGQWIRIFNCIRFVCKDFKSYVTKDSGIRAALEDMYLCKTNARFGMIKKNINFAEFFKKTVSVNGVKYKSINKIMEDLLLAIPERLYDVFEFSIIHGDLCFTNVLVDSNYNFVKLIDPRGKFGTYDIYGDFRYELAKLLHSVDGKYDFIIKDLFVVDYDTGNATVNYTILDNHHDYDLKEIFKEVFRDEIGKDLDKIELIEGLLFLSMIPLHQESLNQQMVMLGKGIEILDRILNIRI